MSLKATYGSGKKEYKKKNYYSQKDGDVVFRIVGALPAFTDDPKGWARFHTVVFGYKNTEGKSRPFESPLVKNHKTKMVDVPCAAQERIDSLKAKLEEAKLAGNQELIDRLNPLVGFKVGNYSVDKNWHMNVIDLQGNVGILKIRHKAKLALDAEIAALDADGVDPLSDENGRFFVFTRTGSGNATGFKVSVYKEKIDVPGLGKVEKDVVHVLTPALEKRVETEGQNLDKIATKLTSEEVALIVSSADLLTGISPAVNDLIDAKWKSERAGNTTKPATTSAVTPVAAAVQDDNISPEEYEEAVVAPVTSKQPLVLPKATSIAATNTVTPQAAVKEAITQAQAIGDLSNDAFFDLIGVPKEQRQ